MGAQEMNKISFSSLYDKETNSYPLEVLEKQRGKSHEVLTWITFKLKEIDETQFLKKRL